MVCYVSVRRSGNLVENRESVAHCAVRLLRDDVQPGRLGRISLAVGYVLELLGDVGNGNTLEVILLAPREDSWQNLVFLGCSEDKDDVFGRFLESFEECVKCGRRKHVDLVDDENAVFSGNWRNEHLVGNLADVVDGVVRSGVHFDDVKRALLVESTAGFAFVARLTVGRQMLAVDGFCEDTRRGSFADTALPAEKIRMSETTGFDGILESFAQGMLPDDGFKCRRAVFTGRYDVFLHSR